MNRRSFFKLSGLAAGGAVLAKGHRAHASKVDPNYDPLAILIDTTECLGCRECEVACAEANGLPEPTDHDDDNVDEIVRKTTTERYTAVTRYETEDGDEVFVKRQCMHCLQPACTAACLANAMNKKEDGPVTWDEDKCLGCRFCMVSCPFEMPKFEYDSTNPRIAKCQMCFGRLEEGEQPACVENCAGDALTFGRRSELINIARQRIAENPDDYYPHIYGEHEVGGTAVLYLAAVPFDQLGFRTDLGHRAMPDHTREFLYSVPIIDVAVPGLLLAMSKATGGGSHDDDEEEA